MCNNTCYHVLRYVSPPDPQNNFLLIIILCVTKFSGCCCHMHFLHIWAPMDSCKDVKDGLNSWYSD